MKFPIVAYGSAILRKKTKEIEENSDELQELLANMFETMEGANGIGLAAPQIGKDIRLFIVDADGIEEPGCEGFRKIFINAQITEESGNPWSFEEGCLSIPHVRGDVMRKPEVTIKYRDENWVEHTETFTGMPARIIQHEYDHIEGVLFVDRLHALKRTMLKGKLQKISSGNIRTDYRMKFPK
ncbi:MAG: peptide deformylase [Bacteroidia bacterium]|jgi:peptide deformylase|nr:peptide deformylase [Bacteroidia bacterium]